tara:strand:+ start:195 stop:1331 length:1137 start_codon:yes stop_codon:yes gene_type:complete
MLRSLLDSVKDQFEKGGKYEKLFPLYDALDTFLYTPSTVTPSAPHVRDSIDLKRSMIFVVIAMIPAILFGIFNIGYQDNPERSIIDNFVFGLYYALPIIIVSYAIGGICEVLFAIIRKHEVNEGFLVTGMLIPLTMPPDIPLWMVAVATAFGVIIGKEIFGGTGYNIFNPALTARAFIYFAYPSEISGDLVWTVDGVSTATPLLQAASMQGSDSLTLLSNASYSFEQMFFGLIPGSIGETSTVACLLGAVFLLVTKVANWRVMVGMTFGMLLTSLIFMFISPYSTNPMLSLPPHYHFVMGSFAFGMVFMATEPVTASHTNKGRWFYGIIIGVMTVIIRSINPAYPEGVMLAILFANAFAPLIDYFVLQENIKRRLLRK